MLHRSTKGFEMPLSVLIGLIVAAIILVIVIAALMRSDGMGFVKGLFSLIGVGD